jgi:hypothetical protein
MPASRRSAGAVAALVSADRAGAGDEFTPALWRTHSTQVKRWRPLASIAESIENDELPEDLP